MNHLLLCETSGSLRPVLLVEGLTGLLEKTRSRATADGLEVIRRRWAEVPLKLNWQYVGGITKSFTWFSNH